RDFHVTGVQTCALPISSLGQLFQSLASDQGVDATGMVIADASGVSAESLVPPATLAGLFAKIATDAEVFGVVRSALPVAGVSGQIGRASCRGAARAAAQ